jgi:hypothetical protein
MMNKYFVADTYKGLEWVGEPYENEKGKLYVKVRGVCDRCGGTGVMASRVENGKIIPIPVDGGVCYGCAGSGYFTKEVRAYTEKEYNALAQAKNKRKEDKEEKMKAEFVKEKEKWLAGNGFSEEGTYVLTGDTYSIKDQLKEDGWKFDKVLLWHKKEAGDYEDRAVFVPIDEVITFTAWGKGVYKTEATDYMKEIFHKDDAPAEASEWFEDTRVSKVAVTLTKKGSYMGRYGLSYVYTFRDDDKHVCVWFTAKDLPLKEGDKATLSGNVKDRKEYQGTYQTIVTRCTVM